MAEIGCKKCTSPRCDGCNNFILEKALRQGKFDALMNGNKTIHIAADVRENVKGEWIVVSGKCGKNIDGRTVKCPRCGNFLYMGGVNGGRGDANFCPNCGAQMGGADNANPD